MFDGEQLHQFIGSSRASSNPLPLVNPLPLSSFPLYHQNHTILTNSSTTCQSQLPNNSFDQNSFPHHSLLIPLQHQQNQFLHPLLHHKTLNNVVTNTNINIGEKQEDQQSPQVHDNVNGNSNNLVSEVDLDQIERDQNMISESNTVHDEPWCDDEVLALLRIRSAMETWFPDFTWEHVSRKLAEVGFKMRSGEKCKEKYEEENRYLNNINNSTKTFNLRPSNFFSELEHLYNNNNNNNNDNNNNNSHSQLQNPSDHHDSQLHHIGPTDKTQTQLDHHHIISPPLISTHQNHHLEDVIFNPKECSDNQDINHNTHKPTKVKKRKRPHCSSSTSSHHDDEVDETKFEMLKGFCEEIVNKLMAQQEEMHDKLLRDMIRRDKEKLNKEEAWKKSETDRMNKELDIMAREQAVAGDRHAAIIEFLKKFNPTLHQNAATTTSPNNSSSSSEHHRTSVTSNPNNHQNPRRVPNPSSAQMADLGKRWPRDEVLALINLRCGLYNNGDHNNQQDQTVGMRSSSEIGSGKSVPLWERISQGMSEMGYKRSAKRCKEKWENINKYFRKTKDVNKKRSVDSRTCPYFHQLSNLYNKGTLHEIHRQDHDDRDDRDDDDQIMSSNTSRGTLVEVGVGVGTTGFDFEF